MNFAVKSCSGGGGKGGRARTGVLQLGNHVVIETPALLISTRKALPHYISPDLLRPLPSPDARLLQFSPLHFLEGVSPKTISTLGGLHQMLGLQQYVFAAVPRDSIASIPNHKATNKSGASFETPSGRHLVTPSDYMELISSMKPNLWTSLADEVPAWVSEKRNKTSVDRTVRWLDNCLNISSMSAHDNKTDGAVFGTIVGGCSVKERQRCAEEVAMRNVSGYWIAGFGLGESMDDRSTLLNAIMDNLPDEKPRQISGLELPEEVLQGIAAGVDLFDSSYIYHLIQGGFALTFPLDGTKTKMIMDDDSRSDQTKINLKATIYRKDTSPIVEGCSCYTCQNHTKAYLNHLLNVHEMLVQTLLEIHNTHHYLGFFRRVREAIKKGKFEEFQQKFIQQRRNHHLIAAASPS